MSIELKVTAEGNKFVESLENARQAEANVKAGTGEEGSVGGVYVGRSGEVMTPKGELVSVVKEVKSS